MANPDDTSKPARSRRNQPKASAAPPATNAPPTPSLTLEQVIANERIVLLQIRAMLHCLHEVLLYADDDDTILHAEVAQTSARLLNESCERLDAVNLAPLIKALRNRDSGASGDDEPDLTSYGPHQVRESRPVYLA